MDILFALLYISVLVVVHLANLEDSQRRVTVITAAQHDESESPRQSASMLSWLLYGFIASTILYAIMIFYTAAVPGNGLSNLNSGRAIDSVAAIINLVLAIVLGGLVGKTVASSNTRRWIQRCVSRQYNPESSVHLTAFVLAALSVSVLMGQFVQQGGLAGLADALQETNSLTAGSIALDALLRVILAFLGVGLGIRRTLPQSLERLGLHLPTIDELRWGIGGGIVIFALSRAVLLIWIALMSPEQFAEQTSAANRISQQFDTLPLAFTLSASAAVGEEILFRGALQPIYGWIPTSIFFALLHIQYTLTPATLIILAVSLGLGWIRIRQSTTAAIIAHFLYNFVPLMLQTIIGSAL